MNNFDFEKDLFNDHIAYQNKINVENGSIREMSDLIFDTLFENKQYPQFDLDMVDFDDEEGEPQVDNKKGIIEFNYGGHYYRMKIELVD